MKRYVLILVLAALNLYAPHPDEIPFLNSIKGRFRGTTGHYISGDNFRSLADHILDEDSPSIKAAEVNAGDVIFVNSSYIEDFFNRCHHRIKNRYILITATADRSMPSGRTANHKCYQADCGVRRFLDDPKLAVWFAQNVDYSHPKLIPIPIGIESVRWGRNFVAIINSLNKVHEGSKKSFLLSANFTVENNQAVRKPLRDSFKRKAFCYSPDKKSLRDYLLDVAHSKFILSPPGNGLDCHRTWEALYLGAYPIVRSSTLDPVFEDLPVLVVNNWEEVTEQLLNQKYEEMSHKEYNLAKLQFDYWANLIHDCQRHIRQNLAALPSQSQSAHPNIHLVLTAALIKNGYKVRKEQYIDAIESLRGFGYVDPYIAESVVKAAPTFLDEHSANVFYAGTNDVRLHNKGVNEIMALKAALNHFNFDDNAMIVKMTGRYYFSSRTFLDAVEHNPDIDAFVSVEPCGNIRTSCFAIRCKYFKEMLDQIDLAKMERENTCFEKCMAEYTMKAYRGKRLKLMNFTKMDVTAYIWGWDSHHVTEHH